jgi:hypothetical protein
MLSAAAVQHAQRGELARAMQMLLEAADTLTSRGFHKRAYECLSLVRSPFCSSGWRRRADLETSRRRP